MTDRLNPYGNHTAYAPEWLTHEVQQALEEVRGDPRSLRRKRTTILRVAEALASGTSLAAVWRRHDCGSKGAWYGETRHGERRAGWVEEPEVAQALEMARRRAEWWVNVRLGREIEHTLQTLVEVAPDGAAQFARVVREGRMTFRRDGAPVHVDASVEETRKVIADVLNRVSQVTAEKQTVIGLDADQFAQMRREARRLADADEAAAVAAWDRQQQEHETG